MDTQTQIDRLIELAIIQRSELKQLVEQLPQLREHLNAEVEKVFDETEPQLRAELEEWTTKQTADKTAALGVALEAKIADLAKSLEVSTQARYNAIIAERAENARLAAQAEAKIAEHAASLPSAVKEIVSAELARFPRAGEIDQLRKEFAEPKSLNPRGKWQAGETYNKLDLVTINGDSYTSNTDGNRTRPSRSSADWTLVAARGTGGGGGPTSLSELTTVPSDGDLLIGSGTSWVTSNLTAGAGISITVGPGAITISATDGDITLDDGTAASPSLHFTNDPDTGIYRPAANTLGISVSGTQVAYFDENGLTVPSAGVVAGGSFHGANGNANNPSFSFTSDQDTGFYRHGTNELGISIGGTEKAVMTSTTFSITPNVSTSGNLTVSGTGTFGGTNLISIPSGGSGTYGYGISNVLSGGGLKSELSYVTSTGVTQLRALAEPGSGNVFALRTKVGGNEQDSLSVNFSGNTTLAGNLTVSGTGQSSVGGYLSINSALAGSTYGRVISGTTTAGVPAFFATNAVNASLAIDFPSASVARIRTNAASEIMAFSIGTTERARFETTGNLLLGTTTDGGQKLQVNGTAKIGTTSFEQFNATGSAQFSAESSGTAQLTLTSAGAYDWRIRGGSTTMVLRRDSTDMLTFDSSSNATFAGDLILGSSGPSVKSTLSARAPRQGLVFDGTNGVTATLGSALGTSAFSWSGWVQIPSTPAAYSVLGGVGTTTNIFSIASSLHLVWQNTGKLRIQIVNATNNGGVYADVDGFSSLVGKIASLSITRSGSTLAVYINGIAQTVTPVTYGSSPGDFSNTVSGTTVLVGGSGGGSGTLLSGYASAPLIYNRALSASEVVALYEAGAPSGADYNSASNTALNTVAPTVVGGGTLSATSATGFTFTGSSASGFVLIPGQSTPALSYVGTRYRVTFTASITTGTVTFSGRGVSVLQNTTAVSAGSNSFIITFNQAMTTNSSAGFEFDSSGTATYSISNLSITPLGLLLAPDAAQAGGGLTWYDTSGNAANITLPASGVSWNVPFAGYVTAPTTTNLTLAGGSSGASLVLGQGANGAPTLAAAGSGTPTITKLGAANGARRVALSLQTGADGTLGPVNIELAAYPSATGSDRYGSLSVGDTGAWRPLVLQHAGGNVLVGGTIDLGAKFAVTGDVEIRGTAWAAYNLSVRDTGGTAVGAAYRVYNASNSNEWRWGMRDSGGSLSSSLSFSFGDGVNPWVTALSLSNTGNATFAGSIRQNQANNISLTSGVATTIFSLGTSAGVYIVTATLDVNGNSGYAIVGKGATGNWQVLANSGSQISFSMSTNDLQITQSSGSTSTTNTFNLLRLR